jgi:Flp pilus assembly protein TadB
MNLYLGAALALALLAAGLGWNNYLDEREAFNTFKGVQAGLAKQQAEDNLKEVAKHVEAIKTALSDRDAALKRLRARAEHPDADRLSSTPSPPKELQSSASTVQDLSPRFELLLEEFRTSLQKEMKR